MNNGYIKLYRKILDNPIACKDGDHLAVWMYILLSATHKETDVLFKGKRITLKSGQLLTGRKAISSKFNISESKVQRILKTLEIERQIEQQTSNQNRLITVVNWELYQDDERQSEQQVNNERTTSEQQVNTNKNDKNEKNVKKYIYDQNFEKFWNLYPKKVSKEEGLKAFKKINITDELLSTILNKLELQKKQDSWVDKQYIPNPSTYLNQKRWEDEVIVKQTKLEKTEIPHWMNKEIKEEKIELTEEEKIEYEQIINGTYGKKTI